VTQDPAAPKRAAASGTDGGLENADIQGLVAAGYGRLPAARYLLLRVQNPVAARLWLGEIADRLTNAAAPVTHTGLNLAVTFAGLERLGLSAHTLGGFPPEFAEGMVTPHRSRMLGDTGASDPARWRWGSLTSRVDILLMLFASDEPTLADLEEATATDLAAAGLASVARLDTVDLGDREHFGFRDGIAQPVIEGFGRAATWRDSIKAGEFVLGYRNEYGRYAPRPAVAAGADPSGILPEDVEDSTVRDFGRNGTYLVFRQLSQDVAGFWQFAEREALASGQGSAEKLAAKIVGRWPSGAPLVRAPGSDDPSLGKLNDFDYGNEDPSGERCPVGAHVRRTNPRDSLDPSPGTDKSVTLVKRHRILRRGREYGAPLELNPTGSGRPPVDDGRERGLHFICLNANLRRQFEFVHGTWVASRKFAGLYDDADPLIASRGPGNDALTIPDQPFRHRILHLPQFVTVVGGAYFFMPGLRAVRFLASISRSGAQPGG